MDPDDDDAFFDRVAGLGAAADVVSSSTSTEEEKEVASDLAAGHVNKLRGN